MPRPRPRLTERRMEARPFEPGDVRLGAHVNGPWSDFYDDEPYGQCADFDRDRMKADWREHRDEIIEFARREYSSVATLWSQKEFDNAAS